MDPNKYTPSGRASVSGIIITVIIGLLASIILPIVYIILSRLIPNIWFIAIIACLLGAGIGLCIDIGVKLGKVRNPKIVITIALICGFLAFYVQWLLFNELMYSNKGFTFNLSGNDLKELFSSMFYRVTHPDILFEEICGLNLSGTFKTGGTVVSGTVLWLLWACEFLVIIGGVIFVAWVGKSSEPYSELNDDWMKIRKPTYIINIDNGKDAFKTELDRRNYSILKDESKEVDPSHFAEVVVYESFGDSTKYVNVLEVLNTTDKKGKVTAKKNAFIKYYSINDSNF